MALELKPLKIADHDLVITTAIEGMHLADYVKEGFALDNYGRFFFYDQLLKASHVLAAYEGDDLAGVMLVNLHDHPKAMHSWWRAAYVKAIHFIERFTPMGSQYGSANGKLLSDYLSTNPVDGEIGFLAAIPRPGVKGVGRFLLAELEKIAPEKHLFLFTDDGCNYGFYDAMGFERVGTKAIEFEGPKGPTTMERMMYVTTVGRGADATEGTGK